MVLIETLTIQEIQEIQERHRASRERQSVKRDARDVEVWHVAAEKQVSCTGRRPAGFEIGPAKPELRELLFRTTTDRMHPLENNNNRVAVERVATAKSDAKSGAKLGDDASSKTSQKQQKMRENVLPLQP